MTKYIYRQKTLEQDKNILLAEKVNKIADKHRVLLEDILFSFSDEINPVAEMDNSSDQKVIIFDKYVCEKNKNDIINHFIQGRQKTCCIIYVFSHIIKHQRI